MGLLCGSRDNISGSLINPEQATGKS